MSLSLSSNLSLFGFGNVNQSKGWPTPKDKCPDLTYADRVTNTSTAPLVGSPPNIFSYFLFPTNNHPLFHSFFHFFFSIPFSRFFSFSIFLLIQLISIFDHTYHKGLRIICLKKSNICNLLK